MEIMPLALAKLVETQAVDLGGEIRGMLQQGRRRITLGLGPGVDVPLLDEELFAADVAVLERDIVVAAIRAEPDGYVVERGWSNFGVYVFTDREPLWNSVPHMGELRGLRPGDQVALGSTPADAVRFRLPESDLVPPPRAVRSARQQRAVEQRTARTTPEAAPRRETTPPPVSRVARPPVAPRRTAEERVRFQRAFEVALDHWRYAMLTFGPDPSNVIVTDHPDLEGLRAAISRNVDQPERGYDLFVKDPGADLWVQPAGDAPRELKKGAVVRLKGAGNRVGFAGFVVEIPLPARPVPRFGPREVPSFDDIAEVLGLSRIELGDPDRVKARYRVLARRFHPDRHDGDPGHLSRFLEIQACFDEWRNRVRQA